MKTRPSLRDQAPAFQRALLDWYRRERRDLPWREKPSLYKTVVSEFMLQQTQVKTVLPYFARWLEALPDFEALAAASEDKVLKLWEGLGYYSRARNLHRLAKELQRLPVIPRDAEAWRELPGIGPYSSAAITSIAFGTPAACVDGNVVRILARLTADATAFRDSASASKAFAPLAQALLNPTNPGDHNQAMMELGATLCTKANPYCERCPVAAFCEGRRTGAPADFPRLAAKQIEQKEVLRIWCLQKGKLLLHRADASAKRLATLHELPSATQLGMPEPRVRELPLLAKKTRSITRYRITECIHALATSPRIEAGSGLLWVPVSELDGISLSGPHRRWVEALLRSVNGS